MMFYIVRRSRGNSTALRQIPQETLRAKVLSMKVNVMPASPPDASLKTSIDTLEHFRSDAEGKMLDSVFLLACCLALQLSGLLGHGRISKSDRLCPE